MKMDFIDKTVIITGGTRGIGLAILKLFKKNNATIIATGTNKEKISKLNKDNKNNKIKYLYLDFTVESSINSFLIQISKLDKIDILVNNAGANIPEHFTKVQKKKYGIFSKTKHHIYISCGTVVYS